MKNTDTLLKNFFEHSKKEIEVSLKALEDGTAEFLESYATASLVGQDFCAVIGDGDGRTKLARLLEASGYKENPEGFFKHVLSQLVQSNSRQKSVNGIVLPYLLLVSLLEKILPGKGYISIKDVDQLEDVTNLEVPEEHRSDLQQVIDTYPVRLSWHTIRQMMVSRDVAYQYMPFIEELDSVGHTNTWIGQFHQGLLEQMYQNRVIFLLNMSCPVYCRFCFRKHKDSRNEANPTIDDVKAAVEHVKNSPSIKEIVVTGGDPFLNRANMAATIDGLMQVEHVQSLRLATRCIAYYPDLFLSDESAYLKYLKQKSLELQQRGKRMEVATHFIHPDEISPESLDIISDLVKSGIPVYVQTPFLKDCNDKGPELVKLFSLLRGAGAELHYIYIPCSPIHGNSIYWAPLSEGIAVASYLRAHLSDRIIPRICTATPIGKLDWHTSGWAVEHVKENENFVWLRTPYTPQYFKAFAPLANELTNIRVNAEGTIDIQYMAKIGDESLFLGSRAPRTGQKKTAVENADQLRIEEMNDLLTGESIVETGSKTLTRLHETRVAIHAEANETDFEYIGADNRITDVVIVSENDAVDSLYAISKIIKKLQEIPHVNAVRLRSLKFNYAPEAYTPTLINRLGELNHLTIVNPLRLEIETCFLSTDEIQPEHATLTRRLNNKGITVYSNTPLLGGINDSPDEIHNLAYLCRQAGIEFHHLYVAGLPVQKQWNQSHPVDMYDVIDIATMVRREGSGREIPRYIIQTPLGEVDYGLTSSFIHDNGNISIKLDCYPLAYFQSMAPDFSFPENVRVDQDGKPVIQISGLISSSDFPI
ncbi:radical SAM domain protein [Candidatus Vecturithrix granuli]|uniref:Radical SAM domain protein n=1 Tax=Vecturithrix granuli TaxID=1499967 RepID=A0A081C4W2_VECG1|nr:radical SAM domain protein [Candidatus Vecturithrix granuli]